MNDLPSLDDIAGEWLLSARPVIVRRRVQWGECDPAQVVYTPRFADYLATAYRWFVRTLLARHLVDENGAALATPMKALSLEFHHVLRPDDLFDMAAHVTAVRQRTFDLSIIGRSPAGEPRFAGRLSPIVVDGNFRSVALPHSLAAALREYQVAHPAPAFSAERILTY